MAALGPLAGQRWRFAAHLGIAKREAPLLAATAGSLDPIDQIVCAADLGFAGVTDNLLRTRPHEVQRRMGAALRERRLAFGTFTHNPLAYEPPFFWGAPIPDLAAALSDTLAAAARIGGGVINLLLLDAGTPPREQLARAADNLRRAGEIICAHGFRAAVEPVSRLRVPLAVAERVEDIAGLLDGGEGCAPGLILDSCHCHLTGDDMAAAIRAYETRIAAVQLADMPGRVEPGAGAVAFAPIMAALEEIGWTGLVEAEFNPAGSGKSGEARAVAALREL